MFKETDIREVLIEKLNDIPTRKLPKLMNIVEGMRHKSKNVLPILSLAGSWKYFDIKGFNRNTYSRRKKSGRNILTT